MTLKQFNEVLNSINNLRIKVQQTSQNINIYMDPIKAQYPNEYNAIIGAGRVYLVGEIPVFFSQRKNDEKNGRAFIIGPMPAIVVTLFNKQSQSEYPPPIKVKKTLADPMRKHASEIKQEISYQTDDLEKFINLITEYLTYLRYFPPSEIASSSNNIDDMDAIFSLINQNNDYETAFKQYCKWRADKGADIFNTYITFISSSISKEKSSNTL